MADYKKPKPQIDDISQGFWEGAKKHELMIQRCKNCGAVYYPATDCNECGKPDMEWVKASGKGTLYTYIIMHQLYHPGFKDELPYNVSIIELEEGPLMLSNITGCKNEDLKIGMPVRAVFEEITEEATLPKFQPA